MKSETLVLLWNLFKVPCVELQLKQLQLVLTLVILLTDSSTSEVYDSSECKANDDGVDNSSNHDEKAAASGGEDTIPNTISISMTYLLICRLRNL